jgi:hypothetical protein
MRVVAKRFSDKFLYTPLDLQRKTSSIVFFFQETTIFEFGMKPFFLKKPFHFSFSSSIFSFQKFPFKYYLLHFGPIFPVFLAWL